MAEIADNVLNRLFHTLNSFKKQITDVIEFSVCNAVLDLFNHEIVALGISFAQTRAMQKQLFESLPKYATPLMHSVLC